MKQMNLKLKVVQGFTKAEVEEKFNVLAETLRGKTYFTQSSTAFGEGRVVHTIFVYYEEK
jgi:hypothetical protein|tara:strand:+ start:2549 stop:2728 length:180 start_codon:yes stop_codon:yes gene_type:complete